MHDTAHKRRAIILSELIALAAILLIAAALFAVLAQRTRHSAGLNQSLANLRQISVWSGSYSADSQDRIMGFSWVTARNGGDPFISAYPDLHSPFSDIEAAANQAVDIIRRRSARTAMPRLSFWYPWGGYWHLPLIEYLDGSLPDLTFVSPGDARQSLWSRNPEAFWSGTLPPQPDPSPENARWAFNSSYEMSPGYINSDGRTTDRPIAYRQGVYQNMFSAQGLGDVTYRRQAEIAFPDAKVLLAERFQSYFGKVDLFHLIGESRVPLLMADGSARIRSTIEANPGWIAELPRREFPMIFNYNPASWEPNLPTGVSDRLEGRYRWTRGNLAGRDFDGPEPRTNLW